MAENRPHFPLYLHLTLAIVSLILGSFGVLGYMIYGSNVPQIVTNTLQTQLPAQMVRVTLVIAVLMTYPLQLYPVIEIAESTFFTKVHSRSKSHLSQLTHGPSIEDSTVGPSLDAPTYSSGPYLSESYPSVVSSDQSSANSNPETEVLLPKDSDLLQYKVGDITSH